MPDKKWTNELQNDFFLLNIKQILGINDFSLQFQFKHRNQKTSQSRKMILES